MSGVVELPPQPSACYTALLSHARSDSLRLPCRLPMGGGPLMPAPNAHVILTGYGASCRAAPPLTFHAPSAIALSRSSEIIAAPFAGSCRARTIIPAKTAMSLCSSSVSSVSSVVHDRLGFRAETPAETASAHEFSAKNGHALEKAAENGKSGATTHARSLFYGATLEAWHSHRSPAALGGTYA
jgi:hypothetical protein